MLAAPPLPRLPPRPLKNSHKRVPTSKMHSQTPSAILGTYLDLVLMSARTVDTRCPETGRFIRTPTVVWVELGQHLIVIGKILFEFERMLVENVSPSGDVLQNSA